MGVPAPFSHSYYLFFSFRIYFFDMYFLYFFFILCGGTLDNNTFNSTGVGYTIRLGYESAKYLLYQGLYHINLD
jgi:hypothetical protein